MYIYDLPFQVKKELCRLLDNDDDWKELAGVHMRYSPFNVIEIEQEAKRQMISPTEQLFTTWGQINHKVEELFILLHRMKHVPALRCLAPIVDSRFHRLLSKHDTSNGSTKGSEGSDRKGNQQTAKADGTNSSIPIPVMLIQKGIHFIPSKVSNGATATNDNTTDESSTNNTSSSGAKPSFDDELLKKISAIPMMPYEELKLATDNWSERNLLGKGGFGQVYKGVWKLSAVAVKRLLNSDGRNNRELIGEMCLNQYRHDNILPLYGYSLGGPEACLVYQYMAGGSLERRLRCKTEHPPLTWWQRYKIAHGVARGLQYLHTMEGTPLIHGDIKPGNILLDQCIMPKIGDFGLARKGPYGEERTHLKVSRVHGTRPYLPDEYLRSHYLSPAVDVFSYGVVMLEIATALPAMDRSRSAQLLSDFMHLKSREGVNLATLEDANVRGTPNSNPPLCIEFATIGLHCTKYNRKERPSMLEVYKRLDSMNIPENYY